MGESDKYIGSFCAKTLWLKCFISQKALLYFNTDKTVILPSQFEHFEDGVFERCFALENLVIYNTVPPQMDGDIFNSDGNLMNDEKWHTKPNKSLLYMYQMMQ